MKHLSIQWHMTKLLPITLTLLLSLNSYTQETKNWTIMHYAAGSNSSEVDLLSDFAEMKQGKISEDYHLITLIDRVEGFSEDSLTLDGNFSDTRLYEIGHESYNRLDGREFFPELRSDQTYDANMGDVQTLKKFIQYAKKYYPAHHYMLILRSHGNGVSMCPDAESGNKDRIYPGEISNVLTSEESIDILGLDVCSMAGLENLYEWRPESRTFSADYVIASAPLSGAWAYDAILKRLTDAENMEIDSDNSFFVGGSEYNLDPKTMSPHELSELVIEEIYDNQRWSSWGAFDNTKITSVKSIVDEASRLLALEDKDLIINIIEQTLGYYHNTSDDLEIAQLTSPYVDAYHFWDHISKNEKFSSNTREKAIEVARAIDDLVLHSYYGRGYFPETDDFTTGRSGIYQIVPLGHRIFSQSKRSFWSHCGWFHPDDISSEDNSYGQYDWCIDGAIRGNNKVDNFYELLDFLFDNSNDESGGWNGYQW